MHITLRLLLLLGLAGFLGSCSSPDRIEWVRHDEWSIQTQFSEWSGGGVYQGIGVGFMRPEDRNTHPYQRSSTYEFHIQSGEPFTILLLLGTGNDEPYPVVLSVFLDYKQVSYGLDGRQGVLHYLEVMPGVDMEIPLEVPIETPGWHDLFVVAFCEPESHPADPQDRLPPSLGVGGRRTVVCAGDCTMPAWALPDVLVGQVTGVHRTNVNALPLSPDDGRPSKQRLLLSATAEPGEAFPLELWARNPDDQLEDYVVLSVLNFQQIPFAGSEVLHLRMPPESELYVPGQIQLPDEEGMHELQFITIFEPYQPLDEVQDPFVQSIMRSALVTKSGE
jgi:hypothetical protein